MSRSRPALAAVLVGAVATLPAQAQDGGQPTRTAFIASDLEYNDNYDLRPDSLGNALLWTTTLGFGLTARTRVDALDLSAQGSVRVSDLPVRGTDTTADNPIVTLGYDRRVDDSALTFSLRAAQSDLDFFDPLSDVDADGGFDLANGGGTRRSLRATAGFAFNEDGPVSLTGNLRASDISFDDNNDPDNEDRRSVAADAEVGFRVSPVLSLTTGALYRREDYDNADQLARRTSRADVGMEARLNRRVTLGVRIGASRVESDRTTGTTTEDGLVGDLTFAILERRGQSTVALASDLDENGERYSLTFGREVTWDNAQLGASVGVSTNSDTDVRLIGDIGYTLAARDRELSLGLSQTASTDEDGENVLNTRAELEFIQLLTRQTSFGLTLNAGLTRFEGSNQANSERVNATAQFNHALTDDWDVNTGYRFRQQRDDTDGLRQSNAVFLGVSRSFASAR